MAALVTGLVSAGAKVMHQQSEAVEVSGLDAAAIGELAGAAGIVLHELTPIQVSLEDAFIGTIERVAAA